MTWRWRRARCSPLRRSRITSPTASITTISGGRNDPQSRPPCGDPRLHARVLHVVSLHRGVPDPRPGDLPARGSAPESRGVDSMKILEEFLHFLAWICYAIATAGYVKAA